MLQFLGSWRHPVHRDGVALVSSSALVSTLMLLGSVGHLSLVSGPPC